MAKKPQKPAGLSRAQEQAIPLFLLPLTNAERARRLRIGERTLYEWLDKSEFRAAIEDQASRHLKALQGAAVRSKSKPVATSPRSGRGSGRKHPQSKGLKRSGRRRLTPRQERLAAALPIAPSIAAAGRMAGYSSTTVYKPSWYRMVRERFLPLALAHLARKGMTLPKVCGKMAEFLDAKKVVAVRVVGKTEEEREAVTIPDYETQTWAAGQYFRIVEKMAVEPKEEDAGKIIELHINFSGKGVSHRPDSSRFSFEVEAQR